MSQDALELQFRELRDQILNANREIEELKKSPLLRLRIKDCFIYLCQVFPSFQAGLLAYLHQICRTK